MTFSSLIKRLKSPNLFLRILNRLQREKQLLWRNTRLLIHFDAKWYLKNNPDVKTSNMSSLMHYMKIGMKEQRNPCSWISTCSMDWHSKYDKVASYNNLLDETYGKQQHQIAATYKKYDTLLLFFNVARDTIGGGMITINNFVTSTEAIFSECSKTGVVMSGVPLSNKIVDYTYFKAAKLAVEFRILQRNTDPSNVILFIPEVFFKGFCHELTDEDYLWLHSRTHLKLVLMNQNDDLMPSPAMFKKGIQTLTTDVVITTAHTRYCTQELARRYGVNVKQLTPPLPFFDNLNRKKFSTRKKIIILSPDEIIGAKYNREYVINCLQEYFPEFKFITIIDMSYHDYIELVYSAMFSITFGEGLDGYFMESIRSGGISFAVYNDTFFPEDFKSVRTVSSDWPSLIELVKKLVPELLSDSNFYDETSTELDCRLNSFSYPEKSHNELMSLLRGENDYSPSFNCFL